MRSNISATAFTCRSPTTTIATIPFYKPADDSPELTYLRDHRMALGGWLPAAAGAVRGRLRRLRGRRSKHISVAPASANRSTTIVFVDILNNVLLKNKQIGK